MSDSQNVPPVNGGEGDKVDLSKYVPVANHIELKKQLESVQRQLASYGEQEEKRKQAEMTAEQRALELEKKNATLTESLTKYQAQLDDVIAGARKDLLAQLPAERQERVKDWPVDQLKTYVSDFVELTNSGKGIPGAKPGAGDVGEYGGYSSFAEWANKDPDGYRKQRQAESRSEMIWAHGIE